MKDTEQFSSLSPAIAYETPVIGNKTPVLRNETPDIQSGPSVIPNECEGPPSGCEEPGLRTCHDFTSSHPEGDPRLRERSHTPTCRTIGMTIHLLKAVFFILTMCLTPSSTAQPPFETWLATLQQEAQQRGISKSVLDTALKNLKPDPRVIGFDRHQPEFTQTVEQYLKARVSKERVEKGRRLLSENKTALDRIGDHYGVDPRYLISFWGLESSYGKHQGTYQVVRSLATLAYDPRRSAFFRAELFNALQILDEGHIEPARMLGGWAGAMGQNQFLPSSFLNYAQDFAGDGHKDIWNDPVDVWASIANYLNKNGWQENQPWGMKVQLPLGFTRKLTDLKPEETPDGCRALRSHTRKMELTIWQQMGVRSERGGELPQTDIPAALIIPQSSQDFTYMVFPNFRTILSYNCANKYAVSVGTMVDLIAP